MKSSKEALFRPNGAAETEPALMDTSIKKNAQGFPETITIHLPKLIKPGELLDRVILQYREQCAGVFRARKMPPPKVTRDQVIEGLRIDEKALEGLVLMEFEGRKPTLILPSGLQRAELVQVSNKNRERKKIPKMYASEFDDDALWGPNIPDNEVTIAEGVLNVAQDPEILRVRGDREKAIMWNDNLKKRGLKSFSGVQRWIMLSLIALSRGKRIATRTLDVLNADGLRELNNKAFISFGRWRNDQFYLADSYPGCSSEDLRVRASVVVDVPKA